MLKTSGDTGVVEFCCGPGPVIANILELSSPEGEICSLRFAVRYVQQARIAFRVSAIACQVVCCTSFWNGQKEGYVSGRRRINRAVNQHGFIWFSLQRRT